MSCNGILSVSRVLGNDYDNVGARCFRQRCVGRHTGVLPPIDGAFSRVAPLPMESGVPSLQGLNVNPSRLAFKNMEEIFDPSARRFADRLSSFLRFERFLNQDTGIKVSYYDVNSPVDDLISGVYDPTLLWSDIHYKAGKKQHRLGEYDDTVSTSQTRYRYGSQTLSF